jgi:hypothetical protein
MAIYGGGVVKNVIIIRMNSAAADKEVSRITFKGK